MDDLGDNIRVMKYFREMTVQALKGFQGLSSYKLLTIIVDYYSAY